MAIYPYFSTTIINKDVLTNSSFKAGMALVLNSNGMAIKADSQSLVFDTVAQKYGKFLGFAASDHDISGNTIIIPDVIGSNYLDSNLNFVINENTEYSVPKRSLLDYQDSAVSNFYNASDLNTISKRGIGVYNTPGDYFVTDQFNAVLHGVFGLDSTTITTLNPGDLLTFGGGINAGKLVKVNANSFGPDVIVIGKVYKHLPNSGLLYFRQVSYKLSFGTNPYILALDAGNALSYVAGSTSVTNLALRTTTGTLINGANYSPLNFGAWSFDGTDDAIDFSGNTLISTSDNFSFEFLAKPDATITVSAEVTSGISGTVGQRFIIEATNEFSNGGFGVSLGTNAIQCIEHGGAYVPILLSYSTNLSGINHFCVVVNNRTSKLYINGVFIKDGLQSPRTSISENTASLGSMYYGKYSGLLYKYSSYNRVLTANEVLNLFNISKGRYGL